MQANRSRVCGASPWEGGLIADMIAQDYWFYKRIDPNGEVPDFKGLELPEGGPNPDPRFVCAMEFISVKYRCEHVFGHSMSSHHDVKHVALVAAASSADLVGCSGCCELKAAESIC